MLFYSISYLKNFKWFEEIESKEWSIKNFIGNIFLIG